MFKAASGVTCKNPWSCMHGEHSNKENYSRNFDPWRREQYVASKFRRPITQLRSVVSQNGWIFRYTAGKTSKFVYIDFLTDKTLLTTTFRGLNSTDTMLNQHTFKHCGNSNAAQHLTIHVGNKNYPESILFQPRGLTMAVLPVAAFLTIWPHQLKKVMC